MLNPYNEPPQENILSTVRRGLARFALPSAADGKGDTFKTIGEGNLETHDFRNPDGSETLMVAADDTQQAKRTSVTLTIGKDGGFRQLDYQDMLVSPNTRIGGPRLTYDFTANELVAEKIYANADGSSVGDTPGAALVVKGTYFSTYTAAGPATREVVTDIQNAEQVIALAG